MTSTPLIKNHLISVLVGMLHNHHRTLDVLGTVVTHASKKSPAILHEKKKKKNFQTVKTFYRY